MEVQKLKKLDNNPTLSWGHNGYTSDHVFHAKASRTAVGFTFELEKIKRYYTKEWMTTEQDIAQYNQIIDQGYSFGVADDGKLVAWIIIDYREWNNSLYIENILVSETYRGRGLGKKLMDIAKIELENRQMRILELETQNTNASAIAFYESQGFSITGLNLKHYKDTNEEFAIFMSYQTAKCKINV
nr:GNAT family N-acetyltransferase [Pedobacter sp. ASV2]